jgi:hypothetical protein
MTRIRKQEDETGYVPGEIAIYLLGAQGGVADDFARLYAVTNPVLLRYLRVTADGDHDELARAAWTSVLPQLQVCPPDDDAWLELVVGAARTAVLAGGGASALTPVGASTTPQDATLDATPDALARAVAAVRACPPAEAEVLAMGAVANLGREAVSRLTGVAPNGVLALVLQGQQHLDVSLEALIDSLRVPATASELADLPFAAGLFAAMVPASPIREPVVVPAAAAATGVVAGPAPALPPLGALPQPTVVDIHSLQSSAPANAERAPTWARSRSARIGAGAAAWLLAVGGISTAAAMSGLLSVAVDGILGGRDRGPLVTAEGPVVPGPLPRPTPTPSDNPPPEQPSTGPGNPPTDSAGRDSTGADDTTTTTRRPTDVRIVLTSFDVPAPTTPATPATPATPVTPVTPTPSVPPRKPPTSVPPTTPSTPHPLVPAGHGKHAGKHLAKGHATQHGNGNAQGHAKAAAKAAKAANKAAKAANKAAKAAQKQAHGQGKEDGTAAGHTNKGKH